MVEIYKVIYSRVVTFVGFLDEFKSLSLSDQKCLLFHNLESVTMVRLAVCLNSSTKRIMENSRKRHGTSRPEDLESELRGSEKSGTYNLKSARIDQSESHLTY